MASVQSLVCPLCPTLYYNSLGDYIKHIELMHSNQPNFSVTCGIGGCLRIFKNVRSFRNHVSAYHSKADLVTNNTHADTHAGLDYEEDSAIGDDHDNSIIDSVNVVSPEVDPYILLKRSTATFLLKLKEKQKLTQVALQSVVEGVTSLFQCHLDVLHAQVKDKVSTLESSYELGTKIDDVFKQEGFQMPFRGLETQHHRTNFFRKNFNLIVSMLLLLILSITTYDVFLIGPSACTTW